MLIQQQQLVTLQVLFFVYVLTLVRTAGHARGHLQRGNCHVGSLDWRYPLEGHGYRPDYPPGDAQHPCISKSLY